MKATTVPVVMLVGVLTVSLAACGEEGSAEPPPSTSAGTPPASSATAAPSSSAPAPPVRKKVTLTTGGGGAGAALCTLFSTAEIADRLGLQVGDGEISGPLDSACQWSVPTEEGGFVQIQTAPASYWNEPRSSKTYRKLSGVGQKAYTDKGFVPGEWTASTLHGKYTTSVGMRNGKASREAAAGILREVLARFSG